MLAVVHIDALSVALLDELVAAGRMPALGDLRRRGSWHSLGTPAVHFPAAAYFSLHSGYPAGEHGLYFSFQWSPPEQRLRYRLDFGTPTTVWERLADSGRRSLVVDPYELGPPLRGSGLAVSGWQYRNILSLERWARPRGWVGPYERRLGRTPFMQEVFGRRSAGALRTVRRTLLTCSARVADLATEALGRERFDVAYVSLLAPHQAGHLFWDVSQLEIDDSSKERFEGTLALMYEEADRALGRIVGALPDGADVMVVSPLGMGPNASRIDLLGPMLQRVLAGGPAVVRREEQEAGDRIWRIRGTVPSPVRAGVARAMGAHLAREVTARLSTSGVDWSTTKAFLLPSDENGQIRLNLRGRERDGIVDPEDASAVLDEIADGLLSYRDFDGSVVIATADRTAGLYPGARHDLLPDLVLRWPDTPAWRVTGVRSDRYGEIRRRPGAGTGRNGAHTTEAWALVVPGRSRARTPAGAPQVSDVAATILASQGLVVEPAGEPLLDPAG
jgi:predicted AlkP superfamily phosphohydrolase/phosphomutase